MLKEEQVLERIQVNIPFRMLQEPGYREMFASRPMNPEIGLDALALDAFGSEEYADAARWFSGMGRSITVHGPFMDLAAGSLDPAVRALTRKRMEQLVAACRTLRPGHVVCHAGYESRRHQFYREEWLSFSLEMWAWVAESLRSFGSRLILENVYEDGPEDLTPLFDALGPEGVGFCLDTGHHLAFGSAPLSQWISVMGPHLRHLHWHDNYGDADLHLPPGQGSIDFTPLLGFLRTLDAGRLPVITLEPHTEEDFWPAVTYLASVWDW